MTTEHDDKFWILLFSREGVIAAYVAEIIIATFILIAVMAMAAFFEGMPFPYVGITNAIAVIISFAGYKYSKRCKIVSQGFAIFSHIYLMLFGFVICTLLIIAILDNLSNRI